MTDVRPRPQQHPSLALLNGFALRLDGRFVMVPTNVQRLLALLAIRHRPQHRVALAGTLWLDTAEDHAARNLRTTLWRTRKLSPALVETQGAYVAIGDDVDIDLADAIGNAEEVLDGTMDVRRPWWQADTASLNGDLLPDWSDDWVLIERERLRQLRMHALEALCVRFTAAGRFAEAVASGLAAVSLEPLRESAHRALIEAHCAEGNLSEAIRHYEAFRQLLEENLGLAPSPALSGLIAARCCPPGGVQPPVGASSF